VARIISRQHIQMDVPFFAYRGNAVKKIFA
jgi:hypothetical protein